MEALGHCGRDRGRIRDGVGQGGRHDAVVEVIVIEISTGGPLEHLQSLSDSLKGLSDTRSA